MERNTVERAIKDKYRHRHKNRIKKGVGKLGWFMSLTSTVTSPPLEGELIGTGHKHNEYTKVIVKIRQYKH